MYDYDSESVKPLFEPVLEMISEIEKEIKKRTITAAWFQAVATCTFDRIVYLW